MDDRTREPSEWVGRQAALLSAQRAGVEHTSKATVAMAAPQPLASALGRLRSRRQTIAAARLLQRVVVTRPGLASPALRQMQQSHGNRVVMRLVAQLQRREVDEGSEVSSDVEEGIRASRSGGHALDNLVRSKMSRAFRTDFGDVRVHTDFRADRLSRALNAYAFTTGRDVFFRAGMYQPGSSSGEKLLAHELTHVVQQRGGVLQGKLTVGRPDDGYEQEAEQVAQQVARSPDPEIQRQDDDDDESEDVQMKASSGPELRRQEDDEEEEPVQMKWTAAASFPGSVAAAGPGP